MSEKLPAVSAAQLRRAMRRAGWIETRQRGSHVRLEKDGASFTIADHGGSSTVPRGTLTAVLKAAGMTIDALRKLL